MYLVRHRFTWKWVAAPILLYTLILGIMVWCGQHYAAAGVDWLVQRVPESLAFLAGPVKALSLALLLVGGYFFYVAVASVVSAPFHEFLSEAIERRRPDGSRSKAGHVAIEVGRGLVHAIRRAGVYLLTVSLLLLLGLVIPVVGSVIATGLGFLVTARFAAFDAFDAIWARRSMTYREKKEYVRAQSGHTLGVGVGVTLLLAVPVLNLFALSVGATSATLGYRED